MNRRSLSVLALVFVAGAVVALGGFFVFGHDRATAAGPSYGYSYGMMGGSYGPGMMGGSYSGGYGPGMIGGSYGAAAQSSVTPAELAAVRDRVEKQLVDSGYKGFKVGEIMAFSRNDYVLVKDNAGKPAFELLADPQGRWLTPEPGPNMMWNTSYGMMRGIGVPGCPYATGSTGTGTSEALTATQAKSRADAWLGQHSPGQVTADATVLPGYFTIDVTANSSKVGMLSVNQTSGAVWYHTWHGSFLADQDF